MKARSRCRSPSSAGSASTTRTPKPRSTRYPRRQRGRADAFVVHARKAWLDGLVARENRDIPPLDHDRVFGSRRGSRRPSCSTAASGSMAAAHLARVDGVMLGRAAYQAPGGSGGRPATVRRDSRRAATKEAVETLLPFIERELARGARLHLITRDISTACSTGCRVRVPSAAIWRPKQSSRARALPRSAPRSPWSWTLTRKTWTYKTWTYKTWTRKPRAPPRHNSKARHT